MNQAHKLVPTYSSSMSIILRATSRQPNNNLYGLHIYALAFPINITLLFTASLTILVQSLGQQGEIKIKEEKPTWIKDYQLN